MSTNLQLLTGHYMPPINLPVAASTTISKGDGIALDADGFAVPCAATATAALVFKGFAEDGVDNSGGADGAKTVRVIPSGFKAVPSIANLSDEGDSDSLVYMSDATTFTNAAGSDPYNVKVGKVYTYSAALGFVLFFQAGTLGDNT